jgi:hypothetical protein
MKIPLLIALILSSPSLGQSQTKDWPIAPPLGSTFFDFRTETNTRAPRIPLKTRRRVLAEVFPKYLADARDCSQEINSETDDYLSAARQSGQIVPSVTDVTTGSFTAPGLTQAAYLISVGECNAVHADNWGTKRIAIFMGDKLVADVDVNFKSRILKKTDLDSDGVDELLMSGGDMNQGIVVETAALFEFRGGRPHVLQDFEKVLEDSCASGTQGSGVVASVILATTEDEKRRMPRLHIENYRGTCRKAKRWKFISKGNMPL